MAAEINRKHLDKCEGAIRGDEPHHLDRTRRIVHCHDPCAGRIATFEPAVVRAVDLDQFAIAFPPKPRSMKHPPRSRDSQSPSSTIQLCNVSRETFTPPRSASVSAAKVRSRRPYSYYAQVPRVYYAVTILYPIIYIM